MRFSLFFRLFIALGGCTTGAIGIAVVVQDHSLSRDLAASAQERVEASARAAESLIDSHLEAVAERYRVIARSPQLRATLELGDAPTLAHYAKSLLSREGALRITFLNPDGTITAEAGETALPLTDLKERGIVSSRRSPCVSILTPLTTGDREIGQLVVLEEVTPRHLEEWSSLVGAEVRFGPPEKSRELISLPLAGNPAVPMVAESTLRREIEAQDRARWNLFGAGLLGLTCALIASWFLSRGFVKPIHAIQSATRELGWGDLTIRVDIDRNDEIGDVASSVNRMAERLQQSADVIHHSNDTLLETNSFLAKSRDRAEEESREKSQRIVDQAPEVLEAIDGITAALQELEKRELRSDSRPLARAARESGQILARRLGRWIDLAQLDLGEEVDLEEELSPHEILRGIVDEFAPLARSRGIRLFSSLAAEVPDRVRGPAKSVAQLLSLFVDERLDLPPGESLFVEVNAGKRVEQNIELTWRVRTTLTVPEEERVSLLESLTGTAEDGSLGEKSWAWTLCRRLGQHLEGSFEVTAHPTRGTSLEFRRTSQITNAPSSSLLPLLRSVDFEALRVLVVDPHPVGAQWLRQQVAIWGATCEIASREDAVAVLRGASLDRDPYQAVLIHGGVGAESARAFVDEIASSSVTESTKVIGVEACGEFADLAGLHALIGDPPDREDLLEALAAARGEPVKRDLRRTLPPSPSVADDTPSEHPQAKSTETTSTGDSSTEVNSTAIEPTAIEPTETDYA